MPATIEELQGIVAGLVSVVKDLTTNVTQVNQTVGNMAEAVPAPVQHENTQGLRMPSIQLPSFRRDSVVQDDISEFLERFNQQTSHLPAGTRFSLLEQQCVGDWPRSVLSIAKTTEGYADKAVEDQLNICIERLRAEFGESKEDKCRRLAAELSAIQQEHGESVEQFAFKYKKLLHQLEKLGEKIAKDCPTFVISQFISKVQPSIAQQLVVKASEFETLDKAVEAARRVELSFQTSPTASKPNQSLDEWKVTPPNAFVSSTSVKSQYQHSQRQQRACYTCGETTHLSRYCPKYRKDTPKQPEICRNYNRFPKSNCEEDGNKCSYGRQHKCQRCNKWGCKAIKHSENRPSSTSRSTVPSDEVNSLRQQLVVLSTRLEKYEAQCTEKSSTSIPAGSENQTSPSASRPPPPASFDQPSTSTPLFGLPAVTIPAHSGKPQTQLCQRNILWTSVTSAGEPLPLPLDSCCSVSLVSKVHADCVASNRPDLKYCALEEPISVTSADSKSDLKAVATMQIPITWENQTETVFTMLVVPGLVWPMLFGENHLHATQALVDHYAPSITFRHPSMQFRVQCSLDNPLQGFANISVPNSSSSCESGSTAQKPHVSITCLLTGAPPLGVNKHSQSLHRGLNFVTVCVTLSAALMGYQVIRQPLWIEGKDIQPGVKVLSGPFDLSQISSNVTPETARPSSDPCYNAQLIDLAETPESVLTEETPDMHITYCTTLAVESKLKKTSIPENVILGNVRDMTKDDDAVLEEAADTTAKQLADGWLTWANTQQPPPSLQTPKDTEHKHCDLDFCAPKQWQLSVQVKEMEDSGLNSSILSPFCDALPEFDCQGPEFPPAEELTCDPYSSAYSDAIFHALDLDGPEYFNVDEDIMKRFKELIRQYPTAFVLPGSPLGAVKGFEHRIDTADAPPIYRHPYKKSPEELRAIKTEIERMLKLKIIQPSHSEWGSPCILVRKPPEKGTLQPPRFVVDYRRLNSVTQGDGYPIPSISSVLDAVSQGKVFAKCDLVSGYWQIPIRKSDQQKTAFCTHLGLYEFLRLPFGLKTAPNTFQRILNTVFADYLHKWLVVYVDDIIQWATTDEEALEHYSLLFQRLVKVGMQLKPTKCTFFAKEIEILGHRITQEGRTPISKGVEAILSMPTPTNTSAVKRFLGLCGYFRDFIPCMSTRTQALRSLLKKGVSFQWTEETAREFQDLKQAITGSDVMLFHPDWNAQFELHVDASKLGCGAMLAQEKDGILRPVRFASRAFTQAESRWTTMHQELFAVKWGLEQFRSYILGRRVKVVTDHANLKWLTTMAPQQAKVARWCMSMAEFDFFIEHRKGERNVVPDVLSRHPVKENIPEDNVVIPPENSVIAFMIIATSVDVPYHTPELVHGTFNNTMACLHNACLIPQAHCLDPVCLAIAAKRNKCAKETQSKTSVTNQTKTPQVGTSQQSPSLDCDFQDFENLESLNRNRSKFAKRQLQDYWLNLLIKFHSSNQDLSAFKNIPKEHLQWVKQMAKRSAVIDGLLMYRDEFMEDPNHYRIMVPNDIQLQRHLLRVYHDSPVGMHRGREATYGSLSYDFYWRNMTKHVRNWIRRCPACIKFKSADPKHGPMQIRIYDRPFSTIGIDYVGQLPSTPAGNKWILTAVCPYSNFLRAIPVPDKQATTAARALFNDVFLQYGFPAVLQSDQGGEWLNAVLRQLTKLLSIEHIVTTSYRPRLNGSTERVHRWLNAAIAIYCEKHQERWEEFLQPAVYAHNVSPIPGTGQISPFFLVFGRNAPSPEVISLDLPGESPSRSTYAEQLVSRMREAQKQFNSIKADMKRTQREYYDKSSRELNIAEGKQVYVRRPPPSSQPKGSATRFIRRFDGPYTVIGHVHGRQDLLRLRHKFTQDEIKTVNIEKIIVVPDELSEEVDYDLRNNEEPPSNTETVTPPELPTLKSAAIDPDLAKLAFAFGHYLNSLPGAKAYASEACKVVYQQIPDAQEILKRCGKLKGLISKCPYLSMSGGSHGGTYLLKLDKDMFATLVSEN